MDNKLFSLSELKTGDVIFIMNNGTSLTGSSVYDSREKKQYFTKKKKTWELYQNNRDRFSVAHRSYFRIYVNGTFYISPLPRSIKDKINGSEIVKVTIKKEFKSGFPCYDGTVVEEMLKNETLPLNFEVDSVLNKENVSKEIKTKDLPYIKLTNSIIESLINQK